MQHERSSRAANAAFWQRQLHRWHASSRSVRAFCRGAGLAEASFYYWRRRLAPSSQEPARPVRNTVLLPVQVIADEAAPGLAACDATAASLSGGADPAAIEIVLGAPHRIRVGCAFQAAALARVLAVLEGEPC